MHSERTRGELPRWQTHSGSLVHGDIALAARSFDETEDDTASRDVHCFGLGLNSRPYSILYWLSGT